MLSSSNFPKEVNYCDYPDSQKHNCEDGDQYIFIRKRKGHNIITDAGGRFGNYLYRNCRNNVLYASYDKPSINKPIYTGGDIGIYSDALQYYKNS